MNSNTITEEAEKLRQAHGDQAMLEALETSLAARAAGDDDRADFYEAVALHVGRTATCHG